MQHAQKGMMDKNISANVISGGICMSVIKIENLVRDYGGGNGVFGVSFYVNQGESFGFLGPNGAGKTTTIRHLMGFKIVQLPARLCFLLAQ